MHGKLLANCLGGSGRATVASLAAGGALVAAWDDNAATREAASAAGIPIGEWYPSLGDLALFRNRNFGPRLRASAPAHDYASLHLPNARHAAATTVWLQHRLLLADRDDVLDVARAATRIQQHAERIVTKGV